MSSPLCNGHAIHQAFKWRQLKNMYRYFLVDQHVVCNNVALLQSPHFTSKVHIAASKLSVLTAIWTRYMMHSNIALDQHLSNSDTQDEQICQQHTGICCHLCLKHSQGWTCFSTSPQATRINIGLEHVDAGCVSTTLLAGVYQHIHWNTLIIYQWSD